MTLRVGDKVRVKNELIEECEDLPRSCLASMGEILIVRKVTPQGYWPLSVSHPHFEDRSFGVQWDEVEPYTPPERENEDS